jgi:tRNA A37 threonylcarbamoyladenosine synthetase subunit TsaC/SUA5/YrdC
METHVLSISIAGERKTALDRAVELLRQGEAVALPT